MSHGIGLNLFFTEKYTLIKSPLKTLPHSWVILDPFNMGMSKHAKKISTIVKLSYVDNILSKYNKLLSLKSFFSWQ